MDWIKRNLFFVIGGVVVLGLLGGAGYYSYHRYQTYTTAKEKLNASYEELKRLHSLRPSPGNEKVDNTKLAREQEAEVKALLGKMGRYFQPIPAVVPQTSAAGHVVVTGEDYAAALRQVIDQLQKEAASGSVLLPPKYGFSFEAQRSLIKFAPGSLEPLARQLAEVRVLVGVLNQAKVNSIESIRRERVSADDNTGPVTDYLDRTSVTNELAVQTPYELTFRCFSTELAGVLTGFAASPYSLVVKGMNIEPAMGTGAIDPTTGQPMNNEATYLPTPVQPVPSYYPPPVAPNRRGSEDGDVFARRYGKGGAMPTPTPAPQLVPTMAAPVQPKIQTVLDERQLKVTILIYVIKLLPPKN